MLASIQKVVSVDSITGGDRIESVKVLGWTCVAKKGEFSPGDLCIFIEPDTIIPKALLSGEHKDLEEYVRLKVIKMKGQISQGLVIPLKSKYSDTMFLTEDNDKIDKVYGDIYEGKDVTEQLKVKKFEKPVPANVQGIVKGLFPHFLRKTDEVRIQSEPHLIEELHGKPYYITQKLDGTSATFYKFGGVFGVCSRNMELKEQETNVYWQMARKYKVEDWLPDGYAIQGEICGPSIQGNRLGLQNPDFFLFSLFNINQYRYIPPEELYKVSKAPKDLPRVPIILTGDSFELTLKDIEALAIGEYSNHTPQEGIVVRAVDQTISFKYINPEFCIKYGE